MIVSGISIFIYLAINPLLLLELFVRIICFCLVNKSISQRLREGCGRSSLFDGGAKSLYGRVSWLLGFSLTVIRLAFAV